VRRSARAAPAGGDVTDATFAAIVGAAHVAPGRPDDAVDGRVPAFVVRPGSAGEVQACVRAVRADGGALVVRGLGAHLDHGAPPERVDVVVALDRLARVVDHQFGDMTVTVEPGCPLPALAATLASAGQWLPLDPPLPDGTTVGGLIAADLSGPLRATQGRVRDLLLGVRVVDGAGNVVAGGGRVVKNVAGYDTPKLHVGALGTLGVIVEATFKVRPRPEREEAVVVACRSFAVAAETALALLDDAVPPFWLELAGPGGLAEGPGDGAAVVAGVAGIAAEVADGRRRMLDAARARGLHAVPVSDGAALRARLGGFAAEPAAAVLRAATLPTDVGACVEAFAAAGAPVRCLAHVASGVVRVTVTRAADVPALVARLRPRLEARGGSLVVERAPAAIKADVDPWGDPGPALALMRGVKAAFDPDRVLAPGRLVAGI
jgi:glycolate oxidase FAD binding subunit